MSYWASAQLESNASAWCCIVSALAGYQTYLRRICVERIHSKTRETSIQAQALFPGYAFVLIEL